MDYLITEHNAITGETIVREMTDEEKQAQDELIAMGNSWDN